MWRLGAGQITGDSLGGLPVTPLATLCGAQPYLQANQWIPLPIPSHPLTDDNELAISLAYALCRHSPRDGFPHDDVAYQYAAWYQSDPFDCGNTCAAAMSAEHGPMLAERMRNTAKLMSPGSKSNGALMRCVPLAIWAHTQQPNEIAHLAMDDAELSHPNRCAAVLCEMLRQV